jgi:putative FmdB family regulatory protein
MPIYEYKCSACSHELESLQKFSDAPLVTCPACGKDALTKLVSAAGFQLKGSGWYQTDFRSSGAKPAAVSGTGKAETGKTDAGSADSGKESAKSGGATSTEAKPAAPTAPATSSSGTPTVGA